MASHRDQMSGGHLSREGDSDSTSHRAHSKRKKSAKDKVYLGSIVCYVSHCKPLMLHVWSDLVANPHPLSP